VTALDENGRPEALQTLLRLRADDPGIDRVLDLALDLSRHDREQLRLARQAELVHRFALDHFGGLSRRQQGIKIKRAMVRASSTETASTPIAKAARELLTVAGKPLSAKHLERLLKP
jgi:hypothetical protein